jgi:hypothetical protein
MAASIILWSLLFFSSVDAAELAELKTGSYVIDNSENPPGDSAQWQPIELPYFSAGTPFAERPMVTWFRFSVDVPAEFSAIYLYRYQTKASVFLNSRLAGGDVEPEGWMVILDR